MSSYAISIITLLIAATAAGQQPATAMVAVPHVATSAVGEVRVVPDRAAIFVGVETRAPTAAAASAANARRLREVMEALKALGIAPDQMTTSEYSVYPEQVFDPDKGDRTPRIIGYVVRNTLRVEVRKVDQLGALLDAALAKGSNTINSLQFTSSQEDSARREALGKAVTKAHADAQAMARAAGKCLADVIDLTTQEGFRPLLMEKTLARGMAAQDATPISPGELTITVNVVGRWRIEGAGSCPPTR